MALDPKLWRCGVCGGVSRKTDKSCIYSQPKHVYTMLANYRRPGERWVRAHDAPEIVWDLADRAAAHMKDGSVS